MELYGALGLTREIDGELPEAEVAAAGLRAARPEIVFVLGGPGSGKGTVCANLVRDEGFVHLSAGDLLRAEKQRASEHGTMIAACIKEGSLVPVAVTLALLKAAIEGNGGRKFLVDGFPRAADQAEEFEKVLGKPDRVIYLDCPEGTMRERLMERGKTSGRADDNEDTIMKRFKTFQEQSVPVVHRYAREGLVVNVDATASKDEVYQQVTELMAPQVYFVAGGPGSGKGTQCSRLKAEFGFTHLSTGDILRANVARGTPEGELLDSYMKEGKMVPMDVIMDAMKKAMSNAGPGKFLLDGFPRSLKQALAYEEKLGKPDGVLFFDCPEGTMRERLLERGKTSGRVDDNEETIMKRFKTFQETTLPVIAHYREQGLLWQFSSIPPKDTVYAAVREKFMPELVVLAGATGSGRGEFSARAGLHLGFHTLRVSKLLEEESGRGSVHSAGVALALRTKRTAPLDATASVLRRAILASPARRFLLDGFPRVVSEGFPSVHDQVFAVEQAVGPIRGCVCLDASADQRQVRVSESPTVGQLAALQRSLQVFAREKLPVVRFFGKLSKTFVVDTSERSPDDVWAEAQPFLE